MDFLEISDIDKEIGPLATRGKKSRVTHRAGSAFSDLHRKNFPRTRRYWTSGHEHLGEARDVKSEQSPFVFPPCSQTLAYLHWWKTRKKQAISERGKRDRDTYRPQRLPDILQRLRVDVEIETEETKKHKDKAIAMTDVYPQYFTELHGRPVKEKFMLEQYVRDIREIFKTKLLIGQERDDCIRIDQQFELESRRLRKTQHRIQQYVSSFEEFLSKDHKESADMLERAERETKLTEEISARRSELSKQYGQSRLDVYLWEETWKMVKMCQMFLFRMSPITWRIKHDWIYRSESDSVIVIDTPDLFSRYKLRDEEASLEDLIEQFEQDIADEGPAELYFEDPFELIRIFRTMEMQNLNALIHLESLAAPMAEISMTITTTEARIKEEIDEITSMINDLEKSIAEVEDRAEVLEEYADYLLRGVFRQFVCSEEVLYLRVFVEDTYEICIGPNDANLDSYSMMKWIERIHEELNLQLDNLPRRIVRACEKEGFKQETKAIRDAEDAARKFELMHRLLDALKRIMQPPTRKKRPLTRRSTPIPPKTRPPTPPPQPTNEEIRYLAFFTDYCKRDDFQEYRSKMPNEDFDFALRREGEEVQADATTPDDVLEEEQQKETEKKVETNECANVENVTESADVFENSSCMYIRKDRISPTRYASSIT